MGLSIWKTASFVLPLGALALLMAFGERTDEGACSGTLGFQKAINAVETSPGVVDTVLSDFRWISGCKFAMDGMADIENGKGFDRHNFEVVVALDPQTQQWQKVSLDLQK